MNENTNQIIAALLGSLQASGELITILSEHGLLGIKSVTDFRDAVSKLKEDIRNGEFNIPDFEQIIISDLNEIDRADEPYHELD